MNTGEETDAFEAELARFLERGFDVVRGERAADFSEDDGYVRVRVLKCAPHEVTELVCGRDLLTGAYKNYVRKTIDARAGIGSAYDLLYRAQLTGGVLPSVPRIEICENDGRELRVVMDYVEGESLEDFAARRGADPELARLVFVPLCNAVERLHSGFADADGTVRPLIHRDLKPSNIIVSNVDESDGADARVQITLIDFGIARTWHDGAASDTVKFGTRSYAPPEQFGFGQTDVRSDVYALGAVLYFCLTGQDPEPGKKIADQVERRCLPKPLAAVVMRAMALDPDERFASARDLRSAFERAMANVRPRISSQSMTSSTQKRGAAVVVGASDVFRDSIARRGAAVFQDSRPLHRSLFLRDTSGATSSSKRPDSPQSLARAAFGMAWNFLVVVALVFVIAGSTSAIIDPTEANRRLSTWYLVLEYGVFIDVIATLVALWLLDKSRLRAYAPILDSARGARFIVRVFVLAIFLYAVIMFIGIATGEIQKL